MLLSFLLGRLVVEPHINFKQLGAANTFAKSPLNGEGGFVSPVWFMK